MKRGGQRLALPPTTRPQVSHRVIAGRLVWGVSLVGADRDAWVPFPSWGNAMAWANQLAGEIRAHQPIHAAGQVRRAPRRSTR